MYTKKSWTKSVLTLSLVAVLSGYALAEQSNDETTVIVDRPGESQAALQRDTSGSQVGINLHRATRLIGSPIKNVQGQKLGTIYDLVLTPELNNVSYAVVSSGGLFGIGRELHAIPWSSVQTGIDGSIVVPISAQEFEQDRGFPGNRWPSEGNPRWLSRAGERTEEVTYDVTTAAEQKKIQLRRFDRVKGMMVRGSEDRNIGTVRDLVVATDTGRVTYTIVSFGGLLGLGEKYSAVPMSAIELDTRQRIARVDVDRPTLQAHAFAPGAFPNLSDPLYAQRLHTSYGIEGYDTVLGYVPAEEPAKQPTAPRTMQPAPRPADKTPAPDTTPRAPAPGAAQPAPSTGRMGAIQIDPGVTFNPAAVKSVQGVVTAVGKFARTGTGPDYLWLQVRADNGDLLNVHAGPLDYVAKQDFYAVSGDRINVTGAPAQAGQQSVFLASQITKDGQVLQLRDREGKPVWEHPAGQPSPGQQSAAMTHTSQDHPEDSSRQTEETPAPDE